MKKISLIKRGGKVSNFVNPNNLIIIKQFQSNYQIHYVINKQTNLRGVMYEYNQTIVFFYCSGGSFI